MATINVKRLGRWLALSALLSAGCLTSRPGRQTMIPDPTIPHRVARDAVVPLWIDRGDGTFVEQPCVVRAGDWVASPLALEAQR